MKKKQMHLESRHFKEIWERVICPVRDLVLEECDESFKSFAGLHGVNELTWKSNLESTYRVLRSSCKELCYGDSNGNLDSRKIASIFCKTLIKHKYFKFDLEKAKAILSEKEVIETNDWIVSNILINYKFAYLVSLQLIYLTLLDELLASPKTVSQGKELARIQHLYKYPRSKGFDSFDTNMVICLAHADIRGDDFDVLLFSMQLYQIEIYTKEKLNSSISFT